jgi:hypothetical protein
VTDFVDADTGITMCKNDRDFICLALSGATFEPCSDMRIAKGLLRLMYENSRVSVMCRRMVLKSFQDSALLQDAWADAIREVCDESSVCAEMRSILWRDYRLLRDESRARVGNSAWKVIKMGSGLHAITSAFLS